MPERMSQQGRIVFASRIPWPVWLMALIAAGAALGVAVEDRNWDAAITVPAVAAIAVIAIMWGSCAWAGRTRLAEVRIEGANLVCKRLDIFNRGKVFAVPLRDTAEWRRRSEVYKGMAYDTVSFQVAGNTYDLPLYSARHVDIEALDRLVAGHAPAGPG